MTIRRSLIAAAAIAIVSSTVWAQDDDVPQSDLEQQAEESDLGSRIVSRRQRELFPRSKSALKNLPDLSFTGVGDKNSIRNFRPDGRMAEQNGLFLLESGQSGAVRIDSGVAAFDLTIEATLDGQGNWFLLFGWDGNHGWLLESITLRKSAAWTVMRIQDQKIVETSRTQTSGRMFPPGFQSIAMRMDGDTLKVTVGRETIVNNVKLPGYAPGDVILGIAPNQYGTKAMKFRRIAIRSRVLVPNDTKPEADGEPIADLDLPADPTQSPTVWATATMFYQKLHDGSWVHKSPEGLLVPYTEAGRTDDYIELEHEGTVVRLYGGHCTIQPPGAKNVMQYLGAWQSDTPADAGPAILEETDPLP